MAARASARPSPKGESKQGLVVTLVFFILATIGLGVATYYGFSEQEDLRKKAEDSDAKQKAEAKLIGFYRFQSILYWTYISTVNGFKAEDLEAFDALRAQFEDGSILPKGKYEKEEEEIKVAKTRIDMLDKMSFKDGGEKEMSLKYDKGTKKPLNTFDEVVVAQKKRYDALKARFDKTEAELKDTQNAEKKAKDEFADYKAENKKSLANQKGEINKDYTQFKNQLIAFTKEKEDLKSQLDAEKVERSKEKEGLEEKLEAVVKKLKEKTSDNQMLQDQLVLTRNKGNDVAKNIRPDFRIVSIDRFGSQPYINIGSSDKVQTQDTFSIHGMGPDGKPKPEIKGTIEVINVVGEHLAQCRVLSTKDSGRDPLLRGDVVFNPTWDPNRRKRIAVMGVIDLAGDGKDQIFEFVRQMERQGVVIDAYLDPASFEIRNTPGITPKTDFLIEGDGLDDTTKLRGLTPDRTTALDNAIKTMRSSARENGVLTMDLRKYLELSGFRVPKDYFKDYNDKNRPKPDPQFGSKPLSGKPADPVKDDAKDGKKEEAAPKKDN